MNKKIENNKIQKIDVYPLLGKHFVLINLLILILSLIAILYGVNNSETHHSDTFRAVAKEIGMGGLVAFILNISIEFVNRKKHENFVNEIGNNLFKAVYGRNIDEAITSQLDKHLFSSDCIRREYFIDAAFALDGDKLLMKNCVSFHVENITKTAKKIPIVKTLLDKMNPLKDHEILVDDVLIYKTLDDENNMAEQNSKLSINHDIDCVRISFQDTLRPGEKIRVVQKYTRTVPNYFNEVFSTTIPLDSFRIRVTDNTNLNLKIVAFSIHPEDEELLPGATQISQEWRVKDAILPGQGVVLSWVQTPAG